MKMMTETSALGRGRPHSEAALHGAGCNTPAISTLTELQRNFLYVVSLEFALGSLDNLQEVKASKDC